MKILIIDNNKNMAKKLKQDLRSFFGDFHEDIVFDLYSTDFSDIDLKKDYDFAFIDIDLNEEYNGIDIALRINESNHNISIVFVSAHNKYIHDALITSPFYFIRKKFYEKDLDIFFSMIANRVELNQILNLKYKDEKSIVPINKIIIIEGQVHQLTISSLYKNYYDNRSLKNIYNLLPNNRFVQIHKSYIINLDYLLEYKGGRVKMANGFIINVGRSYKEHFNNVFKEYLIK